MLPTSPNHVKLATPQYTHVCSTIRASLATALCFVATTVSARAGACWFQGSRVLCDPGCTVVHRWISHTGRDTIEYSCRPPPVPLSEDMWLAIVVVIVVVIGIAAAAAKAGEAKAQRDLDQIAQDTAKTEELITKLENDAREVDAHIASLLAKIPEGDRDGR